MLELIKALSEQKARNEESKDSKNDIESLEEEVKKRHARNTFRYGELLANKMKPEREPPGLSDRADFLRGRLNEVKTEKERLDFRVKELEKDLDTMKKRSEFNFSKRTDNMRKVNELTERVDSLNKVISLTKKNNAELLKVNAGLLEESEQLKTDLRLLKEANARIAKDHTKITHHKELMEDRVNSLEKEQKEFILEKEWWNNENQRLSLELEATKETNAKLLDDLNKFKEGGPKTQNDVIELKHEINTKDILIKDLNELITQLQKDRESHREEVKWFRSCVHQREEKIKELRDEVEQLTKNRDDKQEEIRQLRTANFNLGRVDDDLVKKSADLTKAVKSLQADLHDLRERLDITNTNYTNALTDKRALEKRNKYLLDEKDRLTALVNQFNTANAILMRQMSNANAKAERPSLLDK
jgi:chromosome segregation ATPase